MLQQYFQRICLTREESEKGKSLEKRGGVFETHPSKQLSYTAFYNRKKGFEPCLFLNYSQISRSKLPPGKGGEGGQDRNLFIIKPKSCSTSFG